MFMMTMMMMPVTVKIVTVDVDDNDIALQNNHCDGNFFGALYLT